MPAIVRTVLYMTVIVWLVSLLLPGDVLERASMARVWPWGIAQFVGALAAVAGIGLALWCALAFAFIGRGTPMPLDPPRRLVVVGPYRWVRNPMVLGVGSALAGLALFYESVPLLLATGIFAIGIHGFVTLYEEPTLRRMFGPEYAVYCARVNRWLPRRPRVSDVSAGNR